MKYHWSIAPEQPVLAEHLARRLRISRLLAQCLLNRGLSEPDLIEPFLQPRLSNLSDPFLLPNMEAAVDRLMAARDRKEPMVIFGDYDVDGVTSTALLTEVFQALGWEVSSYLPSRMDEGYGLSREGVENCLRAFPVSLFLAVDCGSTGVESIAWLRCRGVDAIVLDHHQVSDPQPEAVALVNPQLSLDRSDAAKGSFTELCSVGLAFKLAHALVKRGREENIPEAMDYDLRPLLDLVALGTVADLVPLRGENRVLVSIGLRHLEATKRPGLVALKEVAGVASRVGTYEVGFQLAPRLNAAGRLEDATEALRLLLSEELEESVALAHSLDSRNRERQKIERGIADEVIGAIEARFDPERDYVLVEGQMLWHIGVVGIVASRVLQKFHRPTLIVGGEGELWRGSGRSIQGFDLAAALRECGDLLIRHGGHAMAAGVTIHPDKMDSFRERINDFARRTLKREQLTPVLDLDAEITLGEVALDGVIELGRLMPTGPGNTLVQTMARSLRHRRPLQRLGKERQHVKMWVTDGKTEIEAVWWGGGNGSLPVGQFDLAFAPRINEYQGRRSVQLKVLDWRPAE